MQVFETAYPSALSPATAYAAAMPSCVGRIVDITADGIAWVDFPGNDGEAIPARSALAESPRRGNQSIDVLLVFENGDPALPIIAGIVNSTLYPTGDQQEAELSARPSEAVVDGDRVTITGREEIVLACGKSSVTLRKDGKVVIRGTEILSRASGTHRVKGSTVRIN